MLLSNYWRKGPEESSVCLVLAGVEHRKADWWRGTLRSTLLFYKDTRDVHTECSRNHVGLRTTVKPLLHLFASRETARL